MRIIVSFLVGIIGGLAGGVLLAPKSGKKTREELKNELDAMSDKVSKEYNQTIRDAKKTYNNNLKDYTVKGKQAIEQVRKTMQVN